MATVASPLWNSTRWPVKDFVGLRNEGLVAEVLPGDVAEGEVYAILGFAAEAANAGGICVRAADSASKLTPSLGSQGSDGPRLTCHKCIGWNKA